ncbi:hypothetical protein ACP6L2_03965 [Sphingobacterium lactis]|uniref:hypothetical protein n=1 Tax=Sphingobacterium lactis TaxID=797291 RepID=UPI003F7EE422
MDIIWTSFGSRSLLTERDPNEIRTSSEGVPKVSRRKPLERPSKDDVITDKRQQKVES